MKAREKRNIKIDLLINGVYKQTIEKGLMTAKQGIAAAEKIARNYARGNYKHIMVFVHAGELAVGDITARTELGSKRIESYKRVYNI